MEATELRISNIVGCNNKRHHEPYIVVESITSDWVNIDFRPYNLREIEPIPLTEDWLLKLEKIDWLLKDDNGYYVYINKKKIYVLFVHSLQNMYFCIEQKEQKKKK